MVKRMVAPELMTALDGFFYPAVLAYVDWPSGPVRVHTGLQDIAWGGETWAAIGDVAPPPVLPGEGEGLASVDGHLIFGGSPEQVDQYLTDAPQARGRVVKIWFSAFTGPDMRALVAEPVEVFHGHIGGVSETESGPAERRVVAVKVAITSGGSQRAHASPVHSIEDQLLIDPGDTFFRHAAAALANVTDASRRW